MTIDTRGRRLTVAQTHTSMTVLRERLHALYETRAEASVSARGRHAAQATLAIPLELQAGA